MILWATGGGGSKGENNGFPFKDRNVSLAPNWGSQAIPNSDPKVASLMEKHLKTLLAVQTKPENW